MSGYRRLESGYRDYRSGYRESIGVGTGSL